MKNELLKKYLDEIENIKGWYESPLVYAVYFIDNYQQLHSIKGNVAEIGIHQGRSFIPLYILCDNKHKALAVDCFEHQEYNYDQSGKGDYDKFINNIRKFDKKLTKLKVISEDSTRLSPLDYMKLTNGEKFRIFSIDGSHTAAATEIDLKNAYESLVPGGIIIIDDYFLHEWPGVSEGVNRFMIKYSNNLKPFFIGWNKIILTHAEYVNDYIANITKNMGEPVKYSTLFGSKVAVYPNHSCEVLSVFIERIKNYFKTANSKLESLSLL